MEGYRVSLKQLLELQHIFLKHGIFNPIQHFRSLKETIPEICIDPTFSFYCYQINHVEDVVIY